MVYYFHNTSRDQIPITENIFRSTAISIIHKTRIKLFSNCLFLGLNSFSDHVILMTKSSELDDSMLKRIRNKRYYVYIHKNYFKNDFT